MPRDDWFKARQIDIARRAAAEYAREGRSSYEYVWNEVPPTDTPQPKKRRRRKRRK
jgi:hypothetical protein